MSGPGGDPEPGPDITFTSLSPESGAPGTTLTLRGSGFPGGMTARFDFPARNFHRTAPVTGVNPTTARTVVPNDLPCAVYDVTLTAGTGTHIRFSDRILPFQVDKNCVAIPIITGITGQTRTGGTVTVQGLNFVPQTTLTLRLAEGPAAAIPVTQTFVSPQAINVTLPASGPCGFLTVQAANPGTPIASNRPTISVACPTVANWELNLSRLRVQKAQEDGFFGNGDEPYFVVLGFRSRVLTPDSTTVFWGGDLDSDWASGIDAGGQRDIPRDMGVITFPDVTLQALNCTGEIDCLIQMEISKPECMGAVVIAMESDWSRSSTIRSVVEQRKAELQQTVKAMIEEFLTNPNNPPILDLLDQLEKGLDLGFGFNLDDNLAVHVFMFSAVNLNGLERFVPVCGLSRPNTLTSSPLRNRSLQIPFEGDGARYRVDVSLSFSPTGRFPRPPVLPSGGVNARP